MNLFIRVKSYFNSLGRDSDFKHGNFTDVSRLFKLRYLSGIISGRGNLSVPFLDNFECCFPEYFSQNPHLTLAFILCNRKMEPDDSETKVLTNFRLVYLS